MEGEGEEIMIKCPLCSAWSNVRVQIEQFATLKPHFCAALISFTALYRTKVACTVLPHQTLHQVAMYYHCHWRRCIIVMQTTHTLCRNIFKLQWYVSMILTWYIKQHCKLWSLGHRIVGRRTRSWRWLWLRKIFSFAARCTCCWPSSPIIFPPPPLFLGRGQGYLNILKHWTC